jgi:lysophospholipase L1-like esterase
MPVENSPRVPADPALDVAAGAAAHPGRAAMRWLAAPAAVLWFGFAMLCVGEVVLRVASRCGVLLFDTEMWRYAREVKRTSDAPGIVLEHQPGVEATLMGVRVRTDGRGFRRPAPDIEAARVGDERVIAVVGDSCAFGWGVPEGATVGEDLERTLNAAEPPGQRVVVVNASVGNSNTAMEYARYLRDVRPLHPVWVILGYFINDAEPDPSPTTSPLLEHSVLLAMLATRAPMLLVPARRDYLSYYEALYTPGSAAFGHFDRALRAFGAALREDGAMASILLMPEMHEPRHFGPFAHIYRRAAALAAESGFTVVDPSDDFPPGAGQRWWVTPEDSHPNAEAHALFAAALARSEPARRLLGPAS